MTNKYIAAAEKARQLLHTFRLVGEVADAFELIGTMDQAASEARATLSTVQDEIAAARAEAFALKTDEATNAAAYLEAQALRKADAEQRQADADLAVKQARDAAAEIVASARHQAKQDLGDAAERIKLANQELTALKEQTETLQMRLDKLNAQAKRLLGE